MWSILQEIPQDFMNLGTSAFEGSFSIIDEY
jgi:hypothetical protein